MESYRTNQCQVKDPSCRNPSSYWCRRNLQGVVNIIDRVALYNEGEQGETIRKAEVPEDLKELVEEKRALLIETLADVDEEMADIYLEGEEPTVEQIKGAIRRATIGRKFTPVLMGSALANRGIQPVLDSVVDYLPQPNEVLNTGLELQKTILKNLSI